MKKLNQVAMLIAVASVAGSAFASPSTISSDNWRNGHGNLIWKNGTNELCWRDSSWTPATAAKGCDGALMNAQPQVTPTKVQPKAAPEAGPAVVPAPMPADVQKVTYAADAFFDFDKAVLKPEGKAKLDDLAQKIQGINLEVIVATGHTDSIGSAAYNERLSVRRAEAVKAYLVSKGIDNSRIYTEGKGKTQPIDSNKTAAGRAKNRRVEIEVVGTTAQRAK